MKCPGCGYDNEAEALSCNLCQAVLRRESPKAAPAPASLEGDPPKLESGAEINALLLLALQAGQKERFDEAERLMKRLYAEVGILDCAEILVATCDAALKASSLPAAEKSLIQALVAAGAKSLEQGRVADASRAVQPVVKKLAETTAEAFRFQLILLGLRGAAANAAVDQGEPQAIHSPVGLNSLFVHAFVRAEKKDTAAVERLMGRVPAELGDEFCASLVRGLGTAWLATAGYTPDKKDEMLALVEIAASAVERGAYGPAFVSMQTLLKVGVPEQDAGLRLGYLSIGIRTAARAKPAAPPPTSSEAEFQRLAKEGIDDITTGGNPVEGMSKLKRALALLPPHDTECRIKLEAIIAGLGGAAAPPPAAAPFQQQPKAAPTKAPPPSGAAPAPVELNVDFGALIQPLKPPAKP